MYIVTLHNYKSIAHINKIDFTDLKNKLNKEKNKFDELSIKEYDTLLKRNNPYYELVRILKQKLESKFITNAYIKMRELIVKFSDKLTFTNSVLVAELPGSFILCLERFCKERNLQYSWLANSYLGDKKNDYLSDQFGLLKKYPDKWLLGAFGNGDITRLDNIRSIIQDARYIHRNINFVSGDAKVITKDDKGNTNWDTEEIDNIPVITCEIILSIYLLDVGGSAIIKIFSFCERQSQASIYLCIENFEEVYLVKPLTSRPANSEAYLVCCNKKKQILFDDDIIYGIRDDPFISIDFLNGIDMPDSFISLLYNTQRELIESQITSLNEAMLLEEKPYDNSIIETWIKENIN